VTCPCKYEIFTSIVNCSVLRFFGGTTKTKTKKHRKVFYPPVTCAYIMCYVTNAIQPFPAVNVSNFYPVITLSIVFKPNWLECKEKNTLMGENTIFLCEHDQKKEVT